MPDPSEARAEEQSAPAQRDKMSRARQELPYVPLASQDPEAVSAALPDVAEVAPQGTPLPPELLEAAKATFTATGGNIAEVARTHDLTPAKVTRLAAQHDWPVYGEGATAAERSRRTRLVNLANLLERQLFELAGAMGVETKHLEDITEKGLGSKYVAPLTQRSSAFSAVFDRYMRVMTLLEPELFGGDDDPSNPVAAKLRQRKERDSLGGVDGVNRQLAEFAARVAVGTVEAVEASRTAEPEVIDVSPS